MSEGLKIYCYRCGFKITEPAGLMFSPPNIIDGKLNKYHICTKCWPIVFSATKADATVFTPSEEEEINGW